MLFISKISVLFSLVLTSCTNVKSLCFGRTGSRGRVTPASSTHMPSDVDGKRGHILNPTNSGRPAWRALQIQRPRVTDAEDGLNIETPK